MHGNTVTNQFRWCTVLWSTLQQKGSEIWPLYALVRSHVLLFFTNHGIPRAWPQSMRLSLCIPFPPSIKRERAWIAQTQLFILATEFLVNGKGFLEIQDLSSLLQLRSPEFTYSVDKSTTRGPSTSCNLLCFSEKVSHGAQASVWVPTLPLMGLQVCHHVQLA